MKNIFKLARQIFEDKTTLVGREVVRYAIAADLDNAPAVQRWRAARTTGSMGKGRYAVPRLVMNEGALNEKIFPCMIVDLTTDKGLETFDRYLMHIIMNGPALEENDRAVDMIISRRTILGGEKLGASLPAYRTRTTSADPRL